jgi:hypothetical protein
MEQAEIHLKKSEYTAARSIHIKILETTSTDLNAEAYALALLSIAEINVIIGETEQDIHQNLANARKVFNNLRYQTEIILCDVILADLELREKKILSASTLFHKSLHFSWGLYSEITSYCLERLANVSRWSQTKFHWELTWPIIYLVHAYKSKDKLALHKALLFSGDVFLSNKDEDTTHNLYTVALEGFTFMDVHHGRAQCMLHLGDLANERGDISKAFELWKTAQPLFELSLQAKDVAQIDSRLAAVAEAHQKAQLTTFHAPVQVLQQLSISCETGSNIE